MNKQEILNERLDKLEKIKEVLEEVAFLKNPEDLDFTTYYYHEALEDIKRIIDK